MSDVNQSNDSGAWFEKNETGNFVLASWVMATVADEKKISAKRFLKIFAVGVINQNLPVNNQSLYSSTTFAAVFDNPRNPEKPFG